MAANGVGTLQELVRTEAAGLLDHPGVTGVGVWFDVVDGRTVGAPTLHLGMRPATGDPAAPELGETRPSAGGRGFDPEFLAQRVSLPTLTEAVAADALVVDGSPVLDYTHFSLTMSRSRRLARWVAWNVDGASLKKLPRSGMKFRPDPRVPASAQVGDELYAGNRLDRGHIARRADLTWGDAREAAAANADSFYFTNISPQLDDFNQSAREGVWGRIEDAVYAEVEVQDLRISVLGGPVLHDDDRVYRGVALPAEFWKVVVFVEQDVLKARAFLLTQSLDRLEVLDLDEFRAYQVDVADLSARTGIDFGDALTAPRGPGVRPMATARRLDGVDDIRW